MKKWKLLFAFLPILFSKVIAQTVFLVGVNSGTNIVLKNNHETNLGYNWNMMVGLELGKKEAAIHFLPSISISRNVYKAVLEPDIYFNLRQGGLMLQLNSSIKINKRWKFLAGIFSSFLPFSSIDISTVDRNSIGYVSYDDYYNFYNPKELQVGLNAGMSIQPFKTEILWIDVLYQQNVSGILDENYVLERYFTKPKTLFFEEAKAAYISLGLRFLFAKN